MKFALEKYETWKKIIILSLIIALISLFLPWGYYNDKGISGIIFGAYLLLILFVYPLYVMFFNKKMNKRVSIFIAIVGIIILIQLRAVEIIEIDGSMIRPNGPGIYVFIGSLFILMLGANTYKTDIDQIPKEKNLIN